jgi:hypothetical protein
MLAVKKDSPYSRNTRRTISNSAKSSYQRLQERGIIYGAIKRQSSRLAELRHQEEIKERRRKKNGSVPLEY